MTITQLLKEGFKITQVYSGKLNTCACGCAGNYYEKGRGFNNGVKKIMDKADQEFLDTYETGDTSEDLNTYFNQDTNKFEYTEFKSTTEANIQLATRVDDYDNSFGYRVYFSKNK